jgi:hypothetical protein
MRMSAMRNVLETERRPWVPPRPPRRTYSRRTRWLVGVAAASLFLATVGYLVADQVAARQQFDRAQTALGITLHHTAVVTTQLGELRRELNVLTTEVGNDTTALDQDQSQLRGAQTALTAAQAHVSQQVSQIGSLHTCLGGVEKALNALAVANQARALALLSSVSSSCSTAAATSD